MEFARIEKLGSSNYKDWAFEVKAFLRREKLWKYVDPGEAPNPVSDAWTAGDEKALTTIQLLVEKNQRSVIEDKLTAKETWDALKGHHSKLSLEQKVTTIIQIANQSFQDGDNMETYIGEFEKLYGRLDNAGIKMDECVKVALMLRGLPSTFRPLIMALGARDEKDLTLALVKEKLIDEAANYKSTCEAEEKALKVRVARRKVLICYHCGKPGHRKVDCEEYSTEDEEEDRGKKHTQKALKATETRSDVEITLLVASGGIDSKSWIVDSGASSHMTSDRNAFVRFDGSVRSVITTADGRKLRTAGIGDCPIESIDDRGKTVNITLTDVMFVPELQGSLISVGKLSTKGVMTTFNGGTCELTYGDRVIASAARISGLYRLGKIRGRRDVCAGQKHRLPFSNQKQSPRRSAGSTASMKRLDSPPEEVLVRLSGSK